MTDTDDWPSDDDLPELTPEDEEWCRAFFLGMDFGEDEDDG